jgi:CSLREA domain-containing protein
VPGDPTKPAGFGWLVRESSRLKLASRRVFPVLVSLFAGAVFLSAPAAASTTWTVNTIADSEDFSCTASACSLRDAIEAANNDTGDTIKFASSVVGTINLGGVLNFLAPSLNIQGPGANLLTVSGAGNNTVFVVPGGTLHISGLTIANGNSGGGSGGSIYIYPNSGATVTVSNCMFISNTSGSGGGPSSQAGGGAIFIGSGATMAISSSTFFNNSAVNYGGAIANAGTLTVVNSTFSANTGAGGGAIANWGTVTVNDSTITGNTANGGPAMGSFADGGGIINLNGYSITLGGSIVAGNTSSVVHPHDCYQCNLTSSGNNMVGGSPSLGPLTWNGGPTETMIPLPGSPAIGAGTANQNITTDQRDFLRPTAGAVDLGAVQTNYMFVTADTDQLDSPQQCGGGTTCTLRDAMALANTSYTEGADIYITFPGTISTGGLFDQANVVNLMGQGANLDSIVGVNAAGTAFSVGQYGLLNISGLTISGVIDRNGNGGAVNNAGGTLTLNQCALTGNTETGSGGGAIVASSQSSTMTSIYSSTISENTASGNGGAIVNGGKLLVVNSTIAGNTAGNNGGGILNQGTAWIEDSTISQNSASGSGSGFENAFRASVSAFNSIIAGNTAAGSANSDDCDGCGTLDQSNMNGGTPSLGTLAYSPSTAHVQTIMPMPGASGIVGAGKADLLPSYITTDERGFSRLVNGSLDVGAVQTNFTGIVFDQQPPASVGASQTLSPAVTVEVDETDPAVGNPQAVNGIPVTLTFSGGASEVSGTLTESTTSGTAAFGNLSFNTPGTGYTLTVSSPVVGGSAVSSSPFAVTALTAATPTISPAGGVYTSVQSVVLSDTTPGAAIYYTTDGSTPTTSSAQFTSATVAITVLSSETISAIAVAPGYNNSAVASASYTVNLPAAATPAFSWPTGTYNSAIEVSIGDTTSGAAIYYTTDGSTPTTSSAVYMFDLTISSSQTIKAIASGGGYSSSAVASATYTINLPAAATPTFSPAGGSYTSATQVFIGDTIAGVTIYYTTDGSTPTTSSSLYMGPMTITVGETIKAIATGAGYGPSAVATATYTINVPAAAAPTFSLAGGPYATAQTVFISDTTPGATVYYTLDGSTPTANSNLADGPITVSSTETINAIAVASGFSNSAIATAAYAINLPGTTFAATPTFSVPDGVYTSAQSVTISDSTTGATIYYTTDGSTPTTNSNLADGPITVSSTETIQAIAVASGFTNSAIAAAAYAINLPGNPVAATPAFSVATGTYTAAQTVSLSDTTSGSSIYYTTDGSTPTIASAKYSSAIAVSATEVVQAIAVAAGYNNSSVAAAAYAINLPSTPVAATPIFSVPDGVYTSAQTVSISDSTGGAAVYYTTDGSTPTTSSAKYAGAITVSSTETIQAIAVATGYSNSAIASAAYAINLPGNPVAATPTFSVGAGTYTSARTLTLADTTTGSAIYYTTNGTTPTTASTQYSGPITVSSTEVVQAIAVASGYNSSAVAAAAYIINLPGTAAAATPTFSVASGSYTTVQSVKISDSTAGATIYYTTDGSTPTASSNLADGPITVSSTETIQAIAITSGYSNSEIAAAAYAINLPGTPVASTPAFSIASGNYTSAQTVSISDTTTGATIYYTTDGSTPTVSSNLYSSAIAVSSTETLQAIAIVSGYSNSAIAAAAYTFNLPQAQVAAPHFSIGTGTYPSAQTVSITDATAGATIYYTTDGSTPTANSNLANGPITVSSTETLTAIAIVAGDTNSEVVWATYTINPAAPDFTISASNTSATMLQASPAVFNLTVTPLNTTTFPASLTLVATGLPTGATATFSPASIASGAGTTPVTMTISPLQSSALTQPAGSMVGKLAPFSLALLLLPFAGKLRKSGKRLGRMLMVLLLLFAGGAAMAGMSGCGSTNGIFGQMPKAYTVTVTGTMGTVSHSTTTILIVQ